MKGGLKDRLLPIALTISAVAHGIFFLYVRETEPPPKRKPTPVELKIVQAPEPLKVEPPPEPKPEPPKPEPRRLPRRAVKPPPKVPEPLPPPTNSQPPPSNEPPKPVAGLSQDSFASSPGANAPTVGAGNTMMAEPPRQPARPADVKPYAPVDLTAISTEPRLIERPSPVEVFGADYPTEAKAAGIQGVTRVKLLIDEKGIVREVKAVKGPPLLRGPAEALARRFRYKPATQDGNAVAVWWYEEIPFRIND